MRYGIIYLQRSHAQQVKRGAKHEKDCYGLRKETAEGRPRAVRIESAAEST